MYSTASLLIPSSASIYAFIDSCKPGPIILNIFDSAKIVGISAAIPNFQSKINKQTITAQTVVINCAISGN